MKSNLLNFPVNILYLHNRNSNEAFAIAYVSTKGPSSRGLIFSENKKKSGSSCSAYIAVKKPVKRLGCEENPTITYTEFWSEHTLKKRMVKSNLQFLQNVKAL